MKREVTQNPEISRVQVAESTRRDIGSKALDVSERVAAIIGSSDGSLLIKSRRVIEITEKASMGVGYSEDE